MNTLWWLKHKYDLRFQRRMPVPIPNVGRNDLARWCAELGFKAIVEIGVRTGTYTEALCKANPQALVIGVDPWKVYRGYQDGARANTQEVMDAQYRTAKELVPAFGCVLLRKSSMEAVADFGMHSIDMVYIDGNHAREYVLQDIEEWSRIVRPGGIVAGHDYKPMRHPHERIEVFEAVNEYTATHGIKPWFVLGSRRSVPGETRDNPRSWIWVRG